MVISLDEKEFIVNNYKTSGGVMKRLQGMFREKFGYSVSLTPIKKFWLECGFELISPGGNHAIEYKSHYRPRMFSKKTNKSNKYYSAFDRKNYR